MKKEELNTAIGQVDDRLIDEAYRYRKRRWPAWVAVAAVLVLAVGLIAAPWRRPVESGPIYQPSADAPAVDWQPSGVPLAGQLGQVIYPTRLSVGDDGYWEQHRALRDGSQPEPVIAFADTMHGLLDAEENRAYSPLNLYVALAMLAETTDGTTRAEVLRLLGAADVESLRGQVKALWNSNYHDNGVYACLLSNSLWLAEGAPYSQQTIDRLAQDYFAETFAGQMGSEAYNAVLRQWLDDKTGGLLSDAAAEQGFTEQTVLALASTVFMAGRWMDEFSQSSTAPGIFHARHEEQTADFMKQITWLGGRNGEGYTAISKPIAEGGRMIFVLPDGDLADLLARDIVGELLSDPAVWDSWYADLSLPKFDVSSHIDLEDALKEQGVRTVFTTDSDFSPLTSQVGYLSSATHDVRVVIDEEGVTASAMTILDYAGSALPPEPVAITLDRPFLFVITGLDDVPLFVGTVCSVGS